MEWRFIHTGSPPLIHSRRPSAAMTDNKRTPSPKHKDHCLMSTIDIDFEYEKINGLDKDDFASQAQRGILSGEVHTIETKLDARRADIGPGTEYHWKHRIIRFDTPNRTQDLTVRLKTIEQHNNKPRFHFHDFDAEKPDFVDSLHYPDAGSPGGWKKLKKGDKFPPHTDKILIRFAIPRGAPLFNFRAVIFDLTKDWPVPCDPQVGNDPPKSFWGLLK
jgi:hypothetical protein